MSMCQGRMTHQPIQDLHRDPEPAPRRIVPGARRLSTRPSMPGAPRSHWVVADLGAEVAMGVAMGSVGLVARVAGWGRFA